MEELRIVQGGVYYLDEEDETPAILVDSELTPDEQNVVYKFISFKNNGWYHWSMKPIWLADSVSEYIENEKN